MIETVVNSDFLTNIVESGAALQSAALRNAPDPADPNVILHGAQALGKAAFSAVRMEMSPIALYERARNALTKKQEQEARELAHLALWNNARTVVGGVEMSNGEAQEARQHVIDHGDHYAEWAVQQGHIRADEKDAFKEAMVRKKELEDRRGRGISTPAEDREAAEFNKSRMSHALDATTARAFEERRIERSAAIQQETGNTILRRSDPAGTAVDANVFQAYEAVASGPLKPVSQPTAARVKAMGLDL